jgi:hypothetical protein
MKISVRWATGFGALVCTLTAFAFAACSSSSSGGDDSIAPGTDATTSDSGTVVDEATTAAETTACKSYWTAYCTKLGTCNGEDATQVQACITLETAACPQNFFGGSGANVTPASAQTCTTAIAAQNCGDFRAGIPADPSCVLPGTRTQNEPCRASAQCQSHYCVNYAGCGFCGRQYDPTEDCTEISNYPYVTCAPGTFCDRFGTHHCVAYGSIKCNIAKQYLGGCPNTTACVTDGDASVGACVETPNLGSACLYADIEPSDPYVFCGAGACIGGDPIAKDGGTCATPGVVANGDACGNLVDGGYAACGDNLTCTATVYGAAPTCTPNGVAGASCGSIPQTPADDGGPQGIYQAYCSAGFYCSQNCSLTTDGGQQGTCIAGGSTIGALGAACDACNGCSTGLQCVDSKCAPIDYSGCQ